ncbi:MAG: PilW family protein [Chitinophagaceae bacterium]|nr:PilW family protein [Polaromonas sp.]
MTPTREQNNVNVIKIACSRAPFSRVQAGFTLVELLVAMAISGVVVIAAMSALIASRQGFLSVDTASQLRDTARFAVDNIQRLGVQAGYRDGDYGLRKPEKQANPVSGVLSSTETADVTGFNNALVNIADPVNTSTARVAGVVGFGSDILILRNQTAANNAGTVPDNAMIDCNGNGPAAVAIGVNDAMVSILHVAVSATDGEPSLMCTTLNAAGTAFLPAAPLVRGVENFQVLYGVDGVVANTATPAKTPANPGLQIATNYLRADQIVVPGDPVATTANWGRVRSLRIGLVIRAPLVAANSGTNQAQDRLTLQTFYPLGLAPNAAGGAVGTALSSALDAGTIFTPPIDGRLRTVTSFSIHLRNVRADSDV